MPDYKEEGVILQLPLGYKPDARQSQCDDRKQIHRRAVIHDIHRWSVDGVAMLLNTKFDAGSPEYRLHHKRTDLFHQKICESAKGHHEHNDNDGRGHQEDNKEYKNPKEAPYDIPKCQLRTIHSQSVDYDGQEYRDAPGEVPKKDECVR